MSNLKEGDKIRVRKIYDRSKLAENAYYNCKQTILETDSFTPEKALSLAATLLVHDTEALTQRAHALEVITMRNMQEPSDDQKRKEYIIDRMHRLSTWYRLALYETTEGNYTEVKGAIQFMSSKFLKYPKTQADIAWGTKLDLLATAISDHGPRFIPPTPNYQND